MTSDKFRAYVGGTVNMRVLRRCMRSAFNVAIVLYSIIVTFIAFRLNSNCSTIEAIRSFHSSSGSVDVAQVLPNVFQQALAMFDSFEYLQDHLPKFDFIGFREKLGVLSRAHDDLPTIYVIMPTYSRPVQKAELTRLCHTFLLVPKLHWIVVEDSKNRSKLVENSLRNCGVPFTHLFAATINHTKPLNARGVEQRNEGLRWLQANCQTKDQGVVYFADDDNTYSLRLFEEMRKTKVVSVWPVGLVGGLLYESPIVLNGTVTGYYVGWKRDRPFPMDMAAFAINLKTLLKKRDAKFLRVGLSGMLESQILNTLGVSRDQLEPRASECTEILVWHTRTETPRLEMEKKVLSIPANQRVIIDLQI